MAKLQQQEREHVRGEQIEKLTVFRKDLDLLGGREIGKRPSAEEGIDVIL
jgi:hypothetical protein